MGRRGRERELVETINELEQALLATIETLNAAVEARDPYTAGHSQRVRRMAHAAGKALDLSKERLDVLAVAALFHDIGKIGIPDSILTKHDLLTRDEAALMREHATRGAEIVAKFPPFRAAIPAIRTPSRTLGRPRLSRWSRWQRDPARGGDHRPRRSLGHDETDRPYAHALSLSDAMAGVRAERGKRLSPVVVDAFWEVAQRRPADVLPPDEPAATIAVI
jgi:putative nucleotidyltransferase with HDIG domain